MLISHRYLVADYERRNFSISQCDWNTGRAQNIVAIPAPSQQEVHTTESRHLSAGHIAGIAIGSSLALVFLLLAIYQIARKYSAMRTINFEQERAGLDMNASRKYEMDGTQLKQELDNTQHYGQELDGRIHIGHEVEGSLDWIAELPAQENPVNEKSH